jgi:hypothetical protein
MTTTDQQAVTAAQGDREAAAKIYELLGFGPCQHVIDGVEDDVGVVQIVAQRSAEVLASVSSASAERRPDGRAVPGDARTINGDLHFYRAAGWYPAPTPEPVPATNQAGEVEPEAVVRVAKALCSLTGSESCSLSWGDWVSDAKYVLAALATQPATSQEGEARVAVAKALAGHPDSLWDDYEWGDMASYVRERFLEQADLAIAVLAATPTPFTVTSQEGKGALDAAMRNHCLRYGQGETLPPHEMADMIGWLMAQAGLRAPGPIAATPTPPTLSEDLRDIPDEVFRKIADAKDVGTCRARVADLLAALAQVKAS